MSAPQEFPTPWQRQTLWAALTTVAVVSIGAISVGIIWLVSQVLFFLQPILFPFAIAGVLAYLLNPLVSRITAWGTTRHRAVFSVFAFVTILFTGLMIWIVPALTNQSVNLARKVPAYAFQARQRVIDLSTWLEHFGVKLLPRKENGHAPDASTSAPAATSLPQVPETETEEVIPPVPPPATLPDTAAEVSTGDSTFDLNQIITGEWLQAALRQLIAYIGHIVWSSLGGFLGIIGFVISLVIVPIYLFYFLIEGPSIEREWGNYLPLRASAFKDEVVSVLNEINGYLIAFFRGQLVVSLINGGVTGLGLVVAGLEFGLLIGLVLCFLGIIPYLGITMCWLVAVIIASVQGQSWCVQGQAWWVFPLVITAIFVVVHYFDGLFVTPHIVGESVGLHPLTVIFSVFAWSVVLGGLLGAILAVPMTATLKVLLRRYVWERKFRPPEVSLALALERSGVVPPDTAASMVPVAPGSTPAGGIVTPAPEAVPPLPPAILGEPRQAPAP